MTAIGEGLGSWDLAGTSKEDVVEAINAHAKAVRVVQGQALDVAEQYLSGSVEAAKNANAGAADNIAAANETGDALLTLVTTTSENLFTERRTSAATFGGISNKMFFVLRLLPF